MPALTDTTKSHDCNLSMFDWHDDSSIERYGHTFDVYTVKQYNLT